MGWLFYNIPKGTTPRDEVRRIFTVDGDAIRQEVVDSAAKINCVYAAVRQTKKATGESVIMAGVVLIKQIPNAADGYNFGYKDMTEFSGPNETDCPERILKLLSPLESIAAFEGREIDYGEKHSDRWARDWRAACWAKIKARQTRPKITSGVRLELASPIRFTDGIERRRFVAEKDFRTIRWVCLDTSARVKISKRVVDGGTLISP